MKQHMIAAFALVAAFAAPAAAQSSGATTTESKSKTTITTSNGTVVPDTVAKIEATTITTDSAKTNAAIPAIPAIPAMPSPMAAPAANAAAPEGQVAPTTSPVKMEVKVDASLASTVKVSADSAFALARAASPGSQEVSSAELEMENGRLVYEIMLLDAKKSPSEVQIDAMSGEVVKGKKFGGVKATIEKEKETMKLQDAKKDARPTKQP